MHSRSVFLSQGKPLSETNQTKEKQMKIKSANVTYDSRKRAKLFASAWALATCKGHDLSKTQSDGETTVTVYDLNQSQLGMLNQLAEKY